MKRFTSVCALALVVGACGGSGTNPFTATDTSTTTTATTTTTTVPTTVTAVSSGVPDVIANDVERISFNAENKTLTVTGLTQDGTSAANEYRHVADGFKVITSNAGTPADLYRRHNLQCIRRGIHDLYTTKRCFGPPLHSICCKPCRFAGWCRHDRRTI